MNEERLSEAVEELKEKRKKYEEVKLQKEMAQLEQSITIANKIVDAMIEVGEPISLDLPNCNYGDYCNRIWINSRQDIYEYPVDTEKVIEMITAGGFKCNQKSESNCNWSNTYKVS